MKIFVVFYLLILSTLVFSADGDNQSDCNFLKIDSTLNKIYKQVLTEYKNDTLFVQRLKEAQKLWVKFRDAHLESRYPTSDKTNKNHAYGSIYSNCACDELSMLTKERIKQLQEWLKGTVEGDGCGGSYKTSK